MQEQKLQAKQERQNQARNLADAIDSSHNTSIPNYDYDEQLRVYREVLPPNPKRYRAVGYND